MTSAIMPGCESYVVDAGPDGVLLLHGFTGNPTTLRSLAEALAGAGLSVALPRLPGHGTTLDDMMTTSWDDWSATALASYDDLTQRCRRVAVVGLSMGGGLAALVAQQRATVAGGVYINPLVKPPMDALLDGLVQLLEAGVETVESIGSDVKREGVVEASYDATPLGCAKSLFAGIARVHAGLDQITSPSLVLSSREDHVVTSDNGDDFVSMVSGPVERVWLENSYHVATIDNDQELVEALTLSFVHKILGL